MLILFVSSKDVIRIRRVHERSVMHIFWAPVIGE
jgi:hypothetical protein